MFETLLNTASTPNGATMSELTIVRFSQSANACSPMAVTVLGMERYSKFQFLAKAYAAIDATPSGIMVR